MITPRQDRRLRLPTLLGRTVEWLFFNPTGWTYGLLIAIGIAIPFLLLHVAGSMNDEARRGSEADARTAARVLAETDGRTIFDYTHWNAAFAALAGPLDRAFADANIGASLGRTYEISGSLLVDDADAVTYSWLERTALQSVSDAERLEWLGGLIEAVRADTTGAVKQGYVTWGGEAFLASASRVQKEDAARVEHGPVLVLLHALNGPLLARIGDDYALQHLRVVDPTHIAQNGEAVLVLNDAEGKPAITIAWSLDWPGNRMIWSFGVPVMAVLGVLLVLTLFNVVRIQRYAREIAATNLSLSEREAEARAARARAESADHAKTSFLANMSHELRTPLNAVIGFCELLETQLYGSLNQKQSEYLRDIRSSGHHLLGIINDILDTARLGAGQRKLNPERLVLAAVVDDSLRFVRGRAEENGIALLNGVEHGLPMLYADPRSVRQVLINLAGNAVKFTPPGGTVAVKAWIDADGGCVLAIIDNGTGIPRETLTRLFQPFQQGDNTLTRRHEGTGLGLTISRELMVLHGGSLTIESEIGKGTQALARFPVERIIHRGESQSVSTAETTPTDHARGAPGADESIAGQRTDRVRRSA